MDRPEFSISCANASAASWNRLIYAFKDTLVCKVFSIALFYLLYSIIFTIVKQYVVKLRILY